MSISPLLEIASSYCLSPRLRTAPTVAHEEHQYSMDLRVAKWGPMPWCMAVFLNCRRCPLWVIAQTEKNSLRANVFRVTPESGHCSMQSACLKGATTGPLLVHSITLWALATSAGGTESPSCLAILRLMDNSNLVTW